MRSDDQQEVFAFLADPASYPDASLAGTVERIDTHISAVFLVGDRVYKLKRAVDLGFVDFSTLDKRARACAREVEVNALASPDLYRGAVPITRGPDGGLVIDGDGEPVDWLVVMNRFDQATLFDRLIDRGELDRHLMEDLGRTIATFHDRARPAFDAGGAEAMRTTTRGNRDSLARHVGKVFTDAEVTALTDRLRVRRCHGDLHLRNICLTNGRPTLFDAIEFNDAFAVIDVLYDLAFLLMDLDSRQARRLANIVMNAYLPFCDEIDGLSALPLFLASRAVIRAHVSASMAAIQDAPAESESLRGDARAYFDLADRYLDDAPPVLVAVGGLSGSGKSRMGREIAPHLGRAPGAVVLRTDVIRKRLMDAAPEDRLPPEAYTPEMSRRTYDAMYDAAARALATGQSVVADAVFAKPAERDAIAAVAETTGVPFTGLWLEAPREIMAARIEKRIRNASDATVEVLDSQLGYDTGKIGWTQIDSSGPREDTLAAGLTAVRDRDA